MANFVLCKFNTIQKEKEKKKPTQFEGSCFGGGWVLIAIFRDGRSSPVFEALLGLAVSPGQTQMASQSNFSSRFLQFSQESGS